MANASSDWSESGPTIGAKAGVPGLAVGEPRGWVLRISDMLRNRTRSYEGWRQLEAAPRWREYRPLLSPFQNGGHVPRIVRACPLSKLSLATLSLLVRTVPIALVARSSKRFP